MPTAKFDSEAFYERLFVSGQRCQRLVSQLPKTDYNREYGSQLIRSSASSGENYIEALEAAGRKDFIHRLKICRKETRESIHWLRLIRDANSPSKGMVNDSSSLIEEGREIVKILTASIITLEKK